MSVNSLQRKIQHLYLRSGFGASIKEINKSVQLPLSDTLKEIFSNSENYTEIDLEDKSELTFKNFRNNDRKEISKEEKQKFLKQSRENIRDLNIIWIDKMAEDKAQLRDKMTLFWHGHFACRTPVANFAMKQNNTLRKNALGKFGDLLMEISKDPAMLQFLNNQQNKKSSPNENFARELLELFSIGRGNYTEKDIKEAARAFTGWGFNRKGEFQFRKRLHDYDEKIFSGKRGDLSGEDIIQIILENKKTSDFITEKIYCYFVNDKINKERVKLLSKEFYESEYDINKLMKQIFSADWFYDNENIGEKIKSPVELIVSIKRNFRTEFDNPLPLINLQKELGQILFNPPNVAGWSGGRNWIDTSSLMYRMNLGEIAIQSAENNSTDNLNQEKNQLLNMNKLFKNLHLHSDLTEFKAGFFKYSNAEIPYKLIEYLLQKDPGEETLSIVKKYSDDSDKDKFIESLTLRIVSLPEYQIC